MRTRDGEAEREREIIGQSDKQVSSYAYLGVKKYRAKLTEVLVYP